MTALLSERWYRLAEHRPALSPQATVRRQRVRGQRWFVYGGIAGRRPLRLNASAHSLAARLDGRRSVQELWELACAGEGEPPTQDEFIAVLAQLREAGLVDLGGPESAASPATPPAPRTPWAWRITLGRPSGWLEPLRPLSFVLFHPIAGVAWWLAMLSLAFGLLQHAPVLFAHASEWLATPRYVLLGVLLYVPLKALHELAHALAVMRGGGSVHRWGVTLMFGLPMPWVDASDAAAFPAARDRARVGAAGMAAELAVAAAALPLWLALPDGLLRDACFVALLLAGISTVLFNANPLQRLDGYHLLTDLAGLPNLATRSSAWWREALATRLRGRGPDEPMAPAPGERRWLVAYAPLAWVWMLVVVVITVSWTAALAPWLGLLTLVVMGTATVVAPAWRLAAGLRTGSLADARAAGRWRIAFGAGLLLVVGLVAVPLPRSLTLTGVVWPTPDAQLRAQEAGFVVALERSDGAAVRAGEVVARLANPALETAWQRQLARVAAVEAELTQATANDPASGDARVGDLQSELERAQAERLRLEERRAALAIRAGADGRVAWPQPADLLQSWIAQGQLMGQVETGQAVTVRLVLPQDEAVDLPASTDVEIRMATQPDRVLAGSVVHESRAAVDRLPSAALSAAHGGPVVTDPADAGHLKPLRPVVLVDVRLEPGPVRARLGERAWARVPLPAQSVLQRAWRSTVRLLDGTGR